MVGMLRMPSRAEERGGGLLGPSTAGQVACVQWGSTPEQKDRPKVPGIALTVPGENKMTFMLSYIMLSMDYTGSHTYANLMFNFKT